MEEWLTRTGHARGAIVPFAQMWELVQLWYAGRMDPGWRGRSLEDARSILERVGLRGDFWHLG